MYIETNKQQYRCTGATLSGDPLRFTLPDGGPESCGDTVGLYQDDGFLLRELDVSDWGVRLHCAAEIPPGAVLLGVRRHYVRPAGQNGVENTFTCTVQQVIDNVFSTIVLLRPCTVAQDAHYPTLEMELEKADWTALALAPGDPISISIAPKDLLLLRDNEPSGAAAEAPRRR